MRTYCVLCNPPLHMADKYTILCLTCREAAKSIISFINMFQGEKGFPLQSLTDVSNWLTTPLKELKEIPELREKNRFLRLSSTFRDQIDTDILVRSGDKGSSIPARKAVLRSRSENFNNRLGSSDECKPLRKKSMDFIVLPDLKHDELESFIEFLYTAELPEEKMNKHVCALSHAADKYQIPYLLKYCERHLIEKLSLVNVLDVLEVANVRSYLALVKKGALEYIIKNRGEILFSAKYEALALKNPRLCVQITRAFAD